MENKINSNWIRKRVVLLSKHFNLWVEFFNLAKKLYKSHKELLIKIRLYFNNSGKTLIEGKVAYYNVN